MIQTFILAVSILLGAQGALSQTTTLVPTRSTWKYLDNGTNQGTAWRAASFSDTGWAQGEAQLGYGDGDEKTLVNYGGNATSKYITTYFRKKFTVSNPGSFTDATLRLLRDDGAVVYLNGTEVFRSNMPAGTIDYTTLAPSPAVSGAAESTEFFQTALNPALLVSGENVLAVEIHQQAANSSDISFDLELTATLPPGTITLLSPASGAVGVPVPARLEASVSDPQADLQTVTFHGRMAPLNAPEPNFTIAVIPDTQFYSSGLNGGTPAMFTAQTDWIIANRAARNIVYVSHVGDIVQNGDTYQQEWLNAVEAMYDLEDPVRTNLQHGIPYGAAVGNHDSTPIGDADGTTRYFNQYFGISHFTPKPYYGGPFTTANNDNYYELFSAGSMDFVVIYLEYDTSPNQAVLAWADSILRAFPTRRGIVVSHWMVEIGNPGAFSAQGQAFYDALKGNANLDLMLCGHIHGEGRRTDVYQGNTVYSMLADYQGRTNGGNGWMRLLEFSPAANEIRVSTYSPVLNQFETDADSQFNLPYDLQAAGEPFAVIQQNSGVPSGSTTGANWSGLAAGTEYEWYATTTDGGATVSSAPRRFSTATGTPPLAENVNGTTPEDTSVSVRLLATDAEGDALTYSVVSAPSRGSLAGTPPDLAYIPDLNFSGTDTFTYKASDGFYDSNTATVSITVTPVNDAPVGSAQSFTIDAGASQAITLSATDVDNLASDLTFDYTSPTNGTLSGTAPNLIYNPTPDFVGKDSFTFVARDTSLDSAATTISIDVLRVNNLPTAFAQSVTAAEDTEALITLQGSDPDGDPLTFVVQAPSFGTLSGVAPNLRYQPNSNYFGRDSFTFVVNDGRENSAPAEVSITIASVNDRPTAQAIALSIPEGTSASIKLVGSDIEQQPLSYSIVSPPTNGTATRSGDTVVYTPVAGFAGADTFTYTAHDGTLASTEADVTITVEEPRNPWQLVARTGTAAPGTGGGTFTTFAPDFGVDSTGKTAFRGTVTGGSSASGIWAESDAGLGAIVLHGGASPGVTGAVFDEILTGPLTAGTGDLLVYGKMRSGTGGVTTSSDLGYWLGRSGGPLTLVAREDDPAPGLPDGASFLTLSGTAVLTSDGRYGFAATLQTQKNLKITTANDTGVWSNFGGSLTLTAREGSAAPGTKTGTVFDTMTSFELVANEAGQLAFSGPLKLSRSVTSANQFGIWLWDPLEFGLVARGGDSAAGTSAGALFLKPQGVALGGTLSFHATLATGTGGVTTSNDTGLWNLENGALALAAREGSAAPGSVGLFTDLTEGARVNDAGDFVCRAALRTVGAVTTANDAALLSRGPFTQQQFSLIAREGSPAPGTDGAVFAAFDSPLISPDGREAFTGGLVAGAAGVIAANDRGLWLRESDGQLVLALREGDEIEFSPGQSGEISEIALPPSQGAGRSAWSAAGTLSVLVTFADGQSALIKYRTR